MTNTLNGTQYVWQVRPNRLRLPLVYDPGANREVEHWATIAGMTVGELRERVQGVIRQCHHAALVQSMAQQRRPEVYGLGVDSLVVFYTVETDSIVIRGFAPNLPANQTPEELEGGFYCDASWTEP